MILTLELSGPQGANAGVLRRQTFTESGGTIGRLPQSSWVLPHAKVSSRHAVITCKDAVFYIEDTSTNGVAVNSSEDRLAPHRPYALKSGDRLFIEPYEIVVSITGAPDEAVRRHPESFGAPSAGTPFDSSDPFGNDPFQQQAASSILSSMAGSESEGTRGQVVDPMAILGLPPERRPAPRPQVARDLAAGSPLDDHYRPPDAIPVLPPPAPPSLSSTGLPPEGYDPLSDDEPAVPSRSSDPGPLVSPVFNAAPVRRDEIATPIVPRPVYSEPANPPAVPSVPPVPRNAPRPGGDDVGSADLAAMLKGAGLEGAVVTPELARSFGQILRVVVSGVMDFLRARQQIKEEFRLRMTHFQARDNNPLKFSANVEDALHNLLVKRNQAYLPPVAAFEDAFDDLRNHQVAMLAGMRAAFEAMLAEFAPDHLQEQFDRQIGKGALLSMPAKLRYWDLYCEEHRDMVKDPEATFLKLFGEEFARAYEEQFRRLRAGGRAGAGATPTDPEK